MARTSNERKDWYNVKLDESTQTFIETFRQRVEADYQLTLTKDIVLRAIIDHGLRSISVDALNEDPMLLFKVQEVQ